MTQYLKQKLISIFTFAGGIYFFLRFILPEKFKAPFLGTEIEFGKYNDQIILGVQIIGVMAIGLGIGNILRFHGSRLFRGKSGWINSVALLLGMVAVFCIEGVNLRNSLQSNNTWQQLDIDIAYIKAVLSDFQAHTGRDPVERTTLLEQKLHEVEANTHNQESFLYLDTPELQTNRRFQTAAQTVTTLRPVALVRLAELRSEYSLAQQGHPVDLEKRTDVFVATLMEFKDAAKDIATMNLEQSKGSKASHFVLEAFYAPLGAAMFSLLAFYISNAAYRAFRVRSLEAFIMMVAAVIVILGQTPFGPQYIYSDLPSIRLWLLKNVTTPAFRTIYFGAAVAGLAMAVRMWLSMEKNPLAESETES